MIIVIYSIIVILFGVLLFWTWNNTKDFETTFQRIGFTLIGIIVLIFVTLIIYNISKIGIEYPSKEIASEIKRIAMLVFIPLNGFFSLPHIANIKTDINLMTKEQEQIKRKIVILAIIVIIAFIFEIKYLKDFQNGIIQMLNSK